MPTDAEQIATIKTNTLAKLVAISADPQPSYSVDGQQISWQEFFDSLQKRIDWCNTQLSVEEPFEVVTQVFVE